jgi:hypothetical protein
MLLSDRDLKAALASGRLGLTPYDEAMVQPSSIDVRLDRYFRVFANHRYTHIDPAEAQDELTELLEPEGEEPFILHPGEFVLGSTLEVISLGDDLARGSKARRSPSTPRCRRRGAGPPWSTWRSGTRSSTSTGAHPRRRHHGPDAGPSLLRGAAVGRDPLPGRRLAPVGHPEPRRSGCGGLPVASPHDAAAWPETLRAGRS